MRIASGVVERDEQDEGVGYWSGYSPGRRKPDGTITPLGPAQLRDEAARFRRGAERALETGDVARAARLLEAADDIQAKADGAPASG